MEPEKYTCLVVDDEPIARRIITGYIAQLPLLSVAGECINALEAIAFLKGHPEVQLIFLDINMPNLSGLQLLKILQPRQPVILTTAYPEFAVESYELNVADYLLKPFSFERFAKAVYKAIDLFQVAGGKPAQVAAPAGFFIKSEGKSYPVALGDILYCEARKNYTMVVLRSGKRLMPLVPLSKFEAMLQEAGGDFLQVHRSYLVARGHIRSVSPNSVLVDAAEIPIGVQFKERFFRAIGIGDR
ncbi:LytTR family DNA-binding domain-containing protein [Flaviaesturariibacter amylovorans]|uniref:LytTR family DNA-binding domain-containing protein n=1 Tax=Flaviaesturariibacter amylovorans TaxID=1084520 RepID=A0ABP8GF52_9BACT